MTLALRVLAAAATALFLGTAAALTAPNVVPVGESLVTSGQPPASSLATLGAEGFEAVVYLAPSHVPGAVAEEPELLRRQGIEFVHVPIPFDAPSEAHLQAAFAALDRLRSKKTLVHCEVNFRASTVTFLYRVLRLKHDPAEAYAAVSRIWIPRGTWRTFMTEQLARHGIRFEPD